MALAVLIFSEGIGCHIALADFKTFRTPVAQLVMSTRKIYCNYVPTYSFHGNAYPKRSKGGPRNTASCLYISAFRCEQNSEKESK